MIHDLNPRAKASEGLSQFTQTLSRRDVPVQKTKSLIERLVKRS
jgi:hypothetical protein